MFQIPVVAIFAALKGLLLGCNRLCRITSTWKLWRRINVHKSSVPLFSKYFFNLDLNTYTISIYWLFPEDLLLNLIKGFFKHSALWAIVSMEKEMFVPIESTITRMTCYKARPHLGCYIGVIYITDYLPPDLIYVDIPFKLENTKQTEDELIGTVSLCTTNKSIARGFRFDLYQKSHERTA